MTPTHLLTYLKSLQQMSLPSYSSTLLICIPVPKLSAIAQTWRRHNSAGIYRIWILKKALESWRRDLSDAFFRIQIRYIPAELWRLKVWAIADNLETGVYCIFFKYLKYKYFKYLKIKYLKYIVSNIWKSNNSNIWKSNISNIWNVFK